MGTYAHYIIFKLKTTTTSNRKYQKGENPGGTNPASWKSDSKFCSILCYKVKVAGTEVRFGRCSNALFPHVFLSAGNTETVHLPYRNYLCHCCLGVRKVPFVITCHLKNFTSHVTFLKYCSHNFMFPSWTHCCHEKEKRECYKGVGGHRIISFSLSNSLHMITGSTDRLQHTTN